MKVIDVLNKIANGEEVPKKIRYDGDTYYYIEDNREGVCYINTALDKENIWSYFLYNIDTLNDEVEIIEEDKKIEKIEKIEQITDTGLIGSERVDMVEHSDRINRQAGYLSEVVSKINEIIDYLNNKEKE